MSYDPVTGLLTWRERAASTFNGSAKRSVDWVARNWNATYAGRPILPTPCKNGYRYTSVSCQRFLMHRLIWKLVTGRDPETEIDHINGVRTDNRWLNLREVSIQGNGRNMQRQKRNLSGTTGVLWDASRERWAAAIVVDYVTIHLGRFVELNDARNARKAAEKQYNFHKNHGRCPI